MVARSRHRSALAALTAASALLALTATQAAAAPSQPSVGASTGPFTNGGSAVFTWSASTPDADAAIVRYEAGFAGQGLGVYAPDALSSGVVPLGAEGTYVWQVRAVQAG